MATTRSALTSRSMNMDRMTKTCFMLITRRRLPSNIFRSFFLARAVSVEMLFGGPKDPPSACEVTIRLILGVVDILRAGSVPARRVRLGGDASVGAAICTCLRTALGCETETLPGVDELLDVELDHSSDELLKEEDLDALLDAVAIDGTCWPEG
mmetsp:Transcript_8415/g.19811  ORF Transcript_8415/g.19811 Transcript_8415/m.19811 type:complete len:154 (+) Transcript_8415:546-1007(+)